MSNNEHAGGTTNELKRNASDPFRLILQELLSDSIQSTKKRKWVAAELDIPISTVNSALYQGKAGIGTMLAILSVAHDLSDSEIEDFGILVRQFLKARLKRRSPINNDH
ncbi:MAG: hypothetical protein EOP04_02100 [Proteobacteria bacterium]|nr:MAG: hypothetical protein EOP04_02100 [Pseudomonadota bacterium]